MIYNTLYQLYYIDRQKHENVYKTRFDAETTIKFDFNIHQHPAFIFLHTAHFDLISKIYRLDKEVDLVYNKLPKIARTKYIRDTLVSEIKNTNDIEGVVSTKKEIHEILDQLKSKKHDRLYGMVNRYNFLMEEQYLNLETFKDIRAIFDELVKKEVYQNNPENKLDGKIFRKSSVFLYKAAGSVLHEGVTPETNIIDLLTKSLNILNNDKMDLLIRVAIFHYLFGYIHPFYDGNGRVNRFITSMMINKHLSQIMGYHISSQIKHHKKIYYDAFERTNSTHNKGDLGTFVYMFLGIINNAYEYVLENLKNQQIKFDTYIEKLFRDNIFNQIEKKLIYILIQSTMFSEMGSKINELHIFTEMSIPWVRKKLNYLNELGLLIKYRDGKNMIYNLDLEKLDEII